MFGSQILEVGIGLILTFLLVSLILTAVRETIEAWMKTRATDLERALAELLNDQSGARQRLEFYNHPLVTVLFAGDPKLLDFSDRGVVGWVTWPFRTGRNLPSYIPRETFALAAADLVRSGTAGRRLSEAHRALSQGFGEDPARIRKGLEQLYDSAMDRASGWYKRRTQWILFWLGLAIALALNINALTIAQHLATSDAARAQMVGLAERLQGEREPAEDSAVPAAREPVVAASSPSRNPAVGTAGGDRQKASGGAATPAKGAEPSAADTARRLNSLVLEAGMPIGWDEVQVQRIKQSLEKREGWGRCLALLVLASGYLTVALAATLGAPFWFDVLGKVMVIRSTVKPKEKSPDEISKDGGTGGAPRPQRTGGPGVGTVRRAGTS
jgi:hypothetical protein